MGLVAGDAGRRRRRRWARRLLAGGAVNGDEALLPATGELTTLNLRTGVIVGIDGDLPMAAAEEMRQQLEDPASRSGS